MLENLHNYFVLFHFIDIIIPEVISMNSNDFYQLAAELNVMDFTKKVNQTMQILPESMA